MTREARRRRLTVTFGTVLVSFGSLVLVLVSTGEPVVETVAEFITLLGAVMLAVNVLARGGVALPRR